MATSMQFLVFSDNWISKCLGYVYLTMKMQNQFMCLGKSTESSIDLELDGEEVVRGVCLPTGQVRRGAHGPHEPPAILSCTPGLVGHPLDPTQLWHGWLIHSIFANIGRNNPIRILNQYPFAWIVSIWI